MYARVKVCKGRFILGMIRRCTCKACDWGQKRWCDYILRNEGESKHADGGISKTTQTLTNWTGVECVHCVKEVRNVVYYAYYMRVCSQSITDLTYMALQTSVDPDMELTTVASYVL